MSGKRAPPLIHSLAFQIKTKKQGHPVSQMTKVAGKRIAGTQRAEQARVQKRRDSKR